MIARETAKEIPLSELLNRFDASVRPQIQAMVSRIDVEAIVFLEVLQMDSSQFGHCQALAVGSGCSWTLDYILDTPSFRTGDVPSRFHYPTAYARTKAKD